METVDPLGAIHDVARRKLLLSITVAERGSAMKKISSAP